jgi:predicted metal-dependent enzyme (double-stranded beta helix superfamily)
MHVDDIVAKFTTAVHGAADPMAAARSVIDELHGDLDAVAAALAHLSGTGGNAKQAFHRTPELSLLKVCFPAGRRTPPHNHGTWATILVFSGHERNTLYRQDDAGTLRRASEVELARGSILPMRAEAVHVAECLGNEPAIGLHVYGADVLATARHMWDPESLERQPLDWTKYELLAQRASAMQAAP